MPAGGAKSVILGDPRRDKSEALLRALGRAVDRLGGRYIIAEDVGTTPEDMKVIGEETRYVTGRHQDSGPPTAHGVFAAIRAAALRKLGRADLDGVSVAVQGLGSVGRRLCGELAAAGARLVVTDVHEPAIQRVTLETGATAVEPKAIYDADVDVFAPCALGGVLDDDTIARLRCTVVAGSANNQLAEDRHAQVLHQRGILYAPDFVANAGGVIGAAFEGLGQGASDVNARKAVEATERVGKLLEAVFDRADEQGCSTHAAAVMMAKEKIAERRASMR
jgi:leucine dehydrogenase